MGEGRRRLGLPTRTCFRRTSSSSRLSCSGLSTGSSDTETMPAFFLACAMRAFRLPFTCANLRCALAFALEKNDAIVLPDAPGRFPQAQVSAFSVTGHTQQTHGSRWI